MKGTRRPELLTLLPLLSTLFLIVSLVLSSREVPIDSALVLGGPSDSPTHFSGRLQVVRERLGAYAPVRRAWVRLTSEQGSHTTALRLKTDDDGWAEFCLSRKPASPLVLSVTNSQGEVLVRGAPELSTKRWAAAAARRGGMGPDHHQGAVSARVTLQARVLSVPFHSEAQLELVRGGRPVSGWPVFLRASGARILGASQGVSDDRGRFSFQLAPSEHVASLQVKLGEGDEKWEFEQRLPVVAGSFSFTRQGGAVRVHSPIPRPHAWYTIVRETERLGGGRIALSPTPDGGAVGVIPAEKLPRPHDEYLVLSSEADGRSAATVGYPLAGQERTFDAVDAYLLDGARAARAEVTKRHRRLRWWLGAYTGASGLVTVITFVVRIRRADEVLRTRLRQVGATKETSDRSSLPLVNAVLWLSFAFSLGVLWIVAR